MSQPQTIIFQPGTVVVMPNHSLTNKAPVYFYLEGPVTNLPDGLLAQPGGIAVIMYPYNVEGKPGVAFFYSWPDNPRAKSPQLTGLSACSGTLSISPLPVCGLTLMVQAPSFGLLRFFLGQNNKVIRELTPMPGDTKIPLRKVGSSIPTPLASTASGTGVWSS